MMKFNSPRQFLWLAVASVVGFALFALLHNLFYALAIWGEGIPLLPRILELLAAATFLVAVFGCPALFGVALVGFLYLWIKGRMASGR